MAKSLAQILGYATLLGIIQNPEGGVPADILPPGFMSLTQPVAGNLAKWTVTANTRQTARSNAYGAAPKTRDKQNISSKSGVLIHTYESMTHDMSVLQNVCAFDSPERQG